MNTIPTSHDLERLLDENAWSPHQDFAELLLEACSDWPTLNLSEPVALLDELEGEVKAPVTRTNLENYSDQLPATHSEHWAWKQTACVSLLELFRLHGKDSEEFTLRIVIGNLWHETQKGNAGKS